MVMGFMSTKLAELMQEVTRDFVSPRIVDDIDTVLVALLDLRRSAATIHGVVKPCPVGLIGQTEAMAPKTIPVQHPALGPQPLDTIERVIIRYQTDPDSSFQRLQHATRQNYFGMMKRILDQCGERRLGDMDGPEIQRLYDTWSDGGQKLALGHALTTMLRLVLGYGAVLGDAECERLSVIMSKMRFESAKPRSERLTIEHARRIIAAAHERGMHSMALAQAIQFECMLRQKDVIGEWVPEHVPEPSDIFRVTREKWVRGLRWEQIDADLVLRHKPSNVAKLKVFDLKKMPMVMAELERPGMRRASGPVILYEKTQLPYLPNQFRRLWRDIALSVGVPATVRNMDTRAGARERSESSGESKAEAERTAEAAAPAARH